MVRDICITKPNQYGLSSNKEIKTMNQKLYSILRVLLGIFILLGISETGKSIAEGSTKSGEEITRRMLTVFHNQERPLQPVIFYCSRVIDSTKKHLS
ncbi:hypothetical protein [Niabella hibiscisoli]|uniref:hypothetical protein n=1 Tax=Niabella hibiscisoli TaxID=1825928 RepID=UPI001F0FEE45|nr:hypothetical protein [Niabella hibiscisoli]MCH5714779.1 hypothetical protein [Niabella hibiscisoli]